MRTLPDRLPGAGRDEGSHYSPACPVKCTRRIHVYNYYGISASASVDTIAMGAHSEDTERGEGSLTETDREVPYPAEPGLSSEFTHGRRTTVHNCSSPSKSGSENASASTSQHVRETG